MSYVQGAVHNNFMLGCPCGQMPMAQYLGQTGLHPPRRQQTTRFSHTGKGLLKTHVENKQIT